VTLPVDFIRQVPFMLAEDKSKFSMDRLTLRGKAKWPVAFQDPRFALYLKSYQDVLDIALEQAINGRLTKEAVANVQAAVNDLWGKLNAEFPPSTDTRYIEAKQRLEELEATVDLLKHHRVELAIGELTQFGGTAVNELRLFMQRYGLQFAPAKTPDERTLYPKLHSLLVEQREKFNGVVDLQPKN